MLKTLGQPIANIPWEERPGGSNELVWRYTRNPIIPANLLPTSNSIFNGAIVPFKNEFAGVFRCDDTKRRMAIHSGRSRDRLSWQISPDPIQFVCDDMELSASEYSYDPRVCWIEDRY